MRSPIIQLMKQVGLDVDERGVCCGLAMMALQAYLQGAKEYERYSERFDKIIKKGTRCNGDNAQDWMDIQAFLQGVALYQLPDSYPALFPSNKLPSQLKVEEIAAVAQSDLTQKRGGIRKVYSFSGLYNDDKEIDKYLQSYQQAIIAVAQSHGEESRCALLLHCYNHVIMLAYDVHSGWYLQNHDVRHELKKENIKSVIKQVRESYRISFPYGPLILSTTIFSLGDAFSEADKVCSLWCDNADWKQIHAITEEKTKISGYGGWLFIAAQNGHLEVVKALLEKGGANINAAIKGGSTPLYIAAQNGHLEVVEALLGKGADINAARKDGFTPLYTAVKNGHLEVVKALLEKGVDANAATEDGATPLFIAAENGDLEVVEALLGKGGDINAARKDGFTPLYTAVKNGYLEVVKALLEKGADANAAAENGATPFYIAAQNGHLRVVKALLEKGAGSQ